MESPPEGGTGKLLGAMSKQKREEQNYDYSSERPLCTRTNIRSFGQQLDISICTPGPRPGPARTSDVISQNITREANFINFEPPTRHGAFVARKYFVSRFAY